MIIAALSLVVACAELGGETRERPGWSTTAMVSLSVLPLALGAMEVGAVWACLLGGSSAGDGGQDAPVDRPSMCRNAVVPEQPGQAHTVSNGRARRSLATAAHDATRRSPLCQARHPTR